jgi:hypothetical protein
MKVIWNRLWYDKNNWKCLNFWVFFKSTLDVLSLSNFPKQTSQKNEKFNEVLHLFYGNIDFISSWLLARWYKVLKIFKNEDEFKKYVIENRIKMRIRSWEVLIWNIFWDEDAIKCVWIILATEICDTEQEVDNILKNNK